MSAPLSLDWVRPVSIRVKAKAPAPLADAAREALAVLESMTFTDEADAKRVRQVSEALRSALEGRR